MVTMQSQHTLALISSTAMGAACMALFLAAQPVHLATVYTIPQHTLQATYL